MCSRSPIHSYQANVAFHQSPDCFFWSLTITSSYCPDKWILTQIVCSLPLHLGHGLQYDPFEFYFPTFASL